MTTPVPPTGSGSTIAQMVDEAVAWLENLFLEIMGGKVPATTPTPTLPPPWGLYPSNQSGAVTVIQPQAPHLGPVVISSATGAIPPQLITPPVGTIITSARRKAGLHADLTYGGTGPVAKDVAAIAGAGALIVRNSVLWNHMQPTKGGPIDFSVMDDVVDTQASYGVENLGCIAGSPGWASGGGEWTVPTDAAAFNAWVEEYAAFIGGEVVPRYRTKMKKWELWNEENGDFTWQPKPSPQQYIQWFNAVRTAIKKADPTAQVSIGGLMSWAAVGSGSMTGQAFAQALLSSGQLEDPDAWALHPYSGTRGPTTYTQFQDNFSDTLSLIQLLAKYNKNAEVWLTEWGWATNQVSQATQAEFITQSFQLLETAPYAKVTVATLFQAIDQPTQYYYGIMDNNLNPKSSYAPFKAAAAKYQ